MPLPVMQSALYCRATEIKTFFVAAGNRTCLWHLARGHCFPAGPPKYTATQNHGTSFKNPDAGVLH